METDIKLDTEKYRNILRFILFKESPSNSKSVAKTTRDKLLFDYYSTIYLRGDEETTCTLIKENLDKYCQVVDDPDRVNNYIDSIMDVVPKCPGGNRSDWNFNFTTEELLPFIKPLPCNKGNPRSSKINCANSKIIAEDLKKIFDERKKISNKSDYLKRDFPKESTNAKELSPIKPHFVPKIVKNKNLPQNLPQKESEIPKNSFKTAGEELKIQNLKKYGNNANSESMTYGVGKKTLGPRRGNINNKFQPPVLRSETDEEKKSYCNSQGSSEESEIDERLRNIDPKMIEIINNEIMECGPKVTWDDIAGLEFAKNTIQEVVVWPMLRPDIFTGLRRPPKGILLFGPPGTGKTLIGKCIASQSGATFLCISASSLTSKWVGDGEKMVRALFAVARVHQPSVVFIDEIDSLLSQRSDSEHESSRRIKTEFLVQLDGVGTGEDDKILIVGATNRPQELDEAARRRLVKRLYIPLPELNARADMVRKLLTNEKHTLSDADIKDVASLTDGYSGADMKVLCQEASLGPIRNISPNKIRNLNLNEVRPVNFSDFQLALKRVKATVSPNDLDAYVKWDSQFGCGHCS